MFGQLQKKRKAARSRQVYLGGVHVLPAKAFNGPFDWSAFDAASGKDAVMLRNHLMEWLEMPPVSEHNVTPGDLALEVFVSDYRRGSSAWLAMGWSFVWYTRPRVELRARLYDIHTTKNVRTFEERTKMPWRVFIKRALTPRFFFGFGAATREDLENLLGRSLLRVMEGVQSST